MRIDKIKKFYNLARFKADLFSKDKSTKVCALFIEPESLHILSTGYNGMPRNINEDDETRWERPQKYKYVVHAEANGIYNACRSGVSLDKSICLVTFFPCSECTKGIIQVGVKELVTPEPDFKNPKYGEDFKYSIEMLKEAKILITYI
jgi:dCMP deaminase